MEISHKEIQDNCSKNRAKLFERMLPQSVAIIVGNGEVVRNGDVHYAYRQNSDLLYLSQFNEPQSILLLSNLNGRNEFIMFVRPKDKAKEIWTGKRFGTEGAIKHYGADKACVIGDLDQVLTDMLKLAKNVYYTLGIDESVDAKFMNAWKTFKPALFDAGKVISELRLFKSPTEIKLMQKAARISAKAHEHAMRTLGQSGRKNRIKLENQLQAIIEADFRFNGGTGLAYGSIVAGGNNATTLHYESNDAKIGSGDLVLIDAGCEVAGYASDITRTFPASGKFSPSQKAIYEAVLEAQMAAIAMCRPGNTIQSVHDTARTVLEAKLNELGILGQNGTKITDFFMHGTSHYLGLDVHDVGSYKDPNNNDDKAGKNRKLEPGMVITVEPGLYFEKSDTRVNKIYRGIGVRIEDDVLITKDGHVVLSQAAAKTVDDIESLMRN